MNSETNLINVASTSGYSSGTLTVDSTITTVGNTCETIPLNTSGYLQLLNYPYYTYNHTSVPFLTVDKAKNGFIIKKGGETFIAKTAEEILKYLK